MKKILSIIEEETSGRSYSSHKYCFNRDELRPGVSYEEKIREIFLEKYGETDSGLKGPKNLTDLAQKVNQDQTPLFRYFLDGSRRTYKVDDIAYGGRVFPIIAGQIGVGCCERKSAKEFKVKELETDFILTLPNLASKDERHHSLFFSRLKESINKHCLNSRKVRLTKIMGYSADVIKDDEKVENRGIILIQSEMYKAEQLIVKRLSTQNVLNQDTWLLKDGSLEYKKPVGSAKEVSQQKNSYRFVIGVSKAFNPERAKDRSKKSMARRIAELKLFERTPAIMSSHWSDNESLRAVWYLRIRERKYTESPFDGVIKVEKILVLPEEKERGVPTQLVDLISANLINERTPVSYGVDKRWANHLYPVFLTESYLKTQYLSDVHILNLF